MGESTCSAKLYVTLKQNTPEGCVHENAECQPSNVMGIASMSSVAFRVCKS